jgi:hypothetical protein
MAQKGDALSPLLFNIALDDAIGKIQESQVGLKLNQTRELLVYADVNLLEENINTIKQNTDRLCGLVVRVLGYRFGGPGFDSQALQDFPTKKKKENK